jgi:hypothetical protein
MSNSNFGEELSEAIDVFNVLVELLDVLESKIVRSCVVFFVPTCKFGRRVAVNNI